MIWWDKCQLLARNWWCSILKSIVTATDCGEVGEQKNDILSHDIRVDTSSIRGWRWLTKRRLDYRSSLIRYRSLLRTCRCICWPLCGARFNTCHLLNRLIIHIESTGVHGLIVAKDDYTATMNSCNSTLSMQPQSPRWKHCPAFRSYRCRHSRQLEYMYRRADGPHRFILLLICSIGATDKHRDCDSELL